LAHLIKASEVFEVDGGNDVVAQSPRRLANGRSGVYLNQQAIQASVANHHAGVATEFWFWRARGFAAEYSERK
jgi:hypothetical protein